MILLDNFLYLFIQIFLNLFLFNLNFIFTILHIYLWIKILNIIFLNRIIIIFLKKISIIFFHFLDKILFGMQRLFNLLAPEFKILWNSFFQLLCHFPIDTFRLIERTTLFWKTIKNIFIPNFIIFRNFQNLVKIFIFV